MLPYWCGYCFLKTWISRLLRRQWEQAPHLCQLTKNLSHYPQGHLLHSAWQPRWTLALIRHSFRVPQHSRHHLTRKLTSCWETLSIRLCSASWSWWKRLFTRVAIGIPSLMPADASYRQQSCLAFLHLQLLSRTSARPLRLASRNFGPGPLLVGLHHPHLQIH